nr:envelope glycoprotein L [Equid gammaherpesvirus 5]
MGSFAARYVVFVVMILGCGFLWQTCLCDANCTSCCNIVPRDVSSLPSVFEVTSITLNPPDRCNRTNVALFTYNLNSTPADANQTTLCGNGFNLMSFLLALLQRVTDKLPDLVDLAANITAARTDYSLNFSAVKTNTSGLYTIPDNGTVAAETCVGPAAAAASR